MANIITLLKVEEGRKLVPYLCTEGYPTIGDGFRIGPKGAPLEHYQFRLTHAICDTWLTSLIEQTLSAMERHPLICNALANCNDARRAVLVSMAYQMGVTGLANFKMMLNAVAGDRWPDAAIEMMDSTWALQTPNRAKRHQQQMLSGQWLAQYEGHSHVG
ncbi:glycoside hydrolase family protein [Shewanella sp. D64]|uniref:glycoside hydrolase family protein n=1 Tax=unclassified Shewanella TaxID=196818 RepID=UPI0022BA1D09|nr:MULTISPECIES: glycoside hydrolase family protein [unclassified Shewanella]MEC4725852.1 glycoside hydrolase family protein [Shewanella sp. D64]MEC4737107.1 glycoside hydrolase family protein [Shewanella sp. E94]WBJ93563.1 glycoside hydrolase family protein [Shewanella sp. MTB7]WBJ95701.1 glycoside hydrolase family protein [Shewanella sp. MTB7]